MNDRTIAALPALNLYGTLAKSQHVAHDAAVSAASRFSDSLWQMESMLSSPGIGTGSNHWDFRDTPGFPSGFALNLAEYAFARLYRPADIFEPTPHWLTVRYELEALNAFAKFCEKRGYLGFNEIDDKVFYQYYGFLTFGNEMSPGKSERRIRDLIRYIYRIWDYRGSQTNPIRSIPFGKTLDKLIKASTGNNGDNENKTPVIPDAIFAALTSLALDYVLDHGKYIIQAWMEVSKLWNEKSLSQAFTTSRYYAFMNTSLRKILSDIPSPWRNTEWENLRDLYSELQQLRVACTIVILAFSGIRCSELLSIEAGCDVRDVDDSGKYINYINTKIHKHKSGGKMDTWVVIDEVVSAIRILEILSARIRSCTGERRLIISTGAYTFFNVKTDFSDKFVCEITSAGLLKQLNQFVEYGNNNLVCALIPDFVDADGNSSRWKFNSRQFRRTLARHIARQPFGIIAGMIQYKHVRTAVFEGYAGGEPEWNKLLEQEEVLASFDILEEVAIDLSHGQLAGESARQLNAAFSAEFSGRAEDYPPSQILKWLSNKDKQLFIGKFNFCFFDPAKAFCNDFSLEKDRPILNFCQPAHCGNSCVSKRHLPLWDAQLKQVEDLLASKSISLPQRAVLNSEVTELREVVIKFRK